MIIHFHVYLKHKMIVPLTVLIGVLTNITLTNDERISMYEAAEALYRLYPYAELRYIHNPKYPDNIDYQIHLQDMIERNMVSEKISELFSLACDTSCPTYGKRSKCILKSFNILVDDTIDEESIIAYSDDVLCTIKRLIYDTDDSFLFSSYAEYLEMSARIIGRMYMSYPFITEQYCITHDIPIENELSSILSNLLSSISINNRVLNIYTSSFLEIIEDIMKEIAVNEPEIIEDGIRHVCDPSCTALINDGKLYIDDRCITQGNTYPLIGAYDGYICKILTLMKKIKPPEPTQPFSPSEKFIETPSFEDTIMFSPSEKFIETPSFGTTIEDNDIITIPLLTSHGTNDSDDKINDGDKSTTNNIAIILPSVLGGIVLLVLIIVLIRKCRRSTERSVIPYGRTDRSIYL